MTPTRVEAGSEGWRWESTTDRGIPGRKWRVVPTGVTVPKKGLPVTRPRFQGGVEECRTGTPHDSSSSSPRGSSREN